MEENTQKQTKTQLFWEIVRFLLVGGTATLVDYFVFWLFDGVLLPALPIAGEWWKVFSLVTATALGFCVGLAVNWLLSVVFVFKAVKDKKEASSGKSFWIFTLIGVIGLALTEVGVVTLVAVLPTVTVFGKTAFFGMAIDKLIAKVIMTCLVLIWNYVGRKLFVFKLK